MFFILNIATSFLFVMHCSLPQMNAVTSWASICRAVPWIHLQICCQGKILWWHSMDMKTLSAGLCYTYYTFVQDSYFIVAKQVRRVTCFKQNERKFLTSTSSMFYSYRRRIIFQQNVFLFHSFSPTLFLKWGSILLLMYG